MSRSEWITTIGRFPVAIGVLVVLSAGTAFALELMYQARCDAKHKGTPNYHGEWRGPEHYERKGPACADLRAHRRLFPTHRPYVVLSEGDAEVVPCP